MMQPNKFPIQLVPALPCFQPLCTPISLQTHPSRHTYSGWLMETPLALDFQLA